MDEDLGLELDFELDEGDANDVEPSKTYRVLNGRIVGFIDEIEAVKQSVTKALATERFDNAIYSEDYGVEKNGLIGQDIELIAAEMERIVSEALMDDERIVSLDNFTIERTDNESALIQFTVSTIFGDFEQGVEI